MAAIVGLKGEQVRLVPPDKTLRLHRLEAEARIDNVGSRRALEKADDHFARR